MSHNRKRQRDDDTTTVHDVPNNNITTSATTNNNNNNITSGATSSNVNNIILYRPPARRRPSAPPSFLAAPPAALPPWQRVVLSALRRLHGGGADGRRAAQRGRALRKHLARFHEELQRREEGLRARQREARGRLGNKLSAAVERQWARRGDVFQQIVCVEFDEVKRRHTERRQEDLLREAEGLTRSLLDGIFSDARSRPATTTNNNINNNNNINDVGVDTAAAVTEALQNSNMTGEMCGATLESSLSLLDTQNGKRPLRDYQRSALRWMTNLYSRKLNGILADEMGLGKTIQTIALLAFFAEYKNDWGPHLIVVPTTVVLNWKAEFQRWCPGLNVLVYIGLPKERHRIRKGWMKEDAVHVCITSYNLVVRDRAVFRRRPWGFLVLDEAHQVKNFMSKKWQSLFDLQAEYRLLLTGTPLQNSVMELWSLFHFLLPFASAFSSNEEFREWFSNPMEDMVTGRTALNEEIVRRLQALLRPFMLRRLKKDVESQLPSKTEKVIMCRLSRRQRLLYDDYMQLTETQERIKGGAGGILSVLLALRKVCNHPDMFEERRIISPVALDCLSEIVVEVPRQVLLLHNNYKGRYGFHRGRYFIEDISLPCIHGNNPRRKQQRERDTEKEGGEGDDVLLDDSWLDCTRLQLLFCFSPFKCSSHRYSPEHFIRPVHNPLREEYINQKETYSFSSSMCAMLHKEIERQYENINQRYQRSYEIQRERYYEMETCIHVWYPSSFYLFVSLCKKLENFSSSFLLLNPTIPQRLSAMLPIIQKVVVYVPRIAAVHPPRLHCHLRVSHYQPFRSHTRRSLSGLLSVCSSHNKNNNNPHTRRGVFDASSFLVELWPLHIRRCFSFPDKRLLIHDCGKLQFLQHALKQLRRDGHRMLIFTQFVHMLNILERFLAIVGIPYLRIDGSTQAVKRQAFVDRFNEDDRITCMILSTRSGGIGLNLTGADTVIFYDSDWNPTMDLQAQDRCHRIGQTKPVTIYRLISEHTVEENILQKARERKKLNNVVIRGGQFHAMASVDEMYEDSSAALAALSVPLRLRSFFHDLDEDATVVEMHGNNNNNNNKEHGDELKEEVPVDIRREMMQLEDQEDREAQQNVEEELRELEEQKRNDEAELAEDEDDDDDEGEGEKGRKRKRAREGKTGDEFEEGLMDLQADNSSLTVPKGTSAAVLQKRREILRRQRSPLDRLLSVRFGVCHDADARKRYNNLRESYASYVGEDELPVLTTVFSL